MRHQLVTCYGETPSRSILIVKGAAADDPPADSIAWLCTAAGRVV